MSKEPASQSEIVLYQTEDGRTRLEVGFEGERAWLSQGQNIFAEGELHGDSVVKESLTTAADGKNYATNLDNLDVIINQPSPAEKDFEVLLELPGGFSLDGLKGAERRQSF
jgi:hypothetical protein